MSWLESLSWAAGICVMCSAIPNIRHNMTARKKAEPLGPSPGRDALQMIGNLMWAVFGLLTDVYAIAAMCGLNACFMAWLLVQQIQTTNHHQNKEGLTNE